MTDNPPIRIHIYRNERRITFKIKSGYCLGHLTHGTMNLVTSNENKITKDKNCENVPHLETTEVY